VGAKEAERERLLRTLARLKAELGALVSGANLPSIVAALTEREAQRSRLEQELAALDELEQVRGFDLQRVEPDLRAKLDDCRLPQA
jgi:mannose/fructose-specific phosphotransferase system component IIA